MSTFSLIIILAAVVAVVAWAVRFVLRKRGGPTVLPLVVDGLGIIGYDKTVMTRWEAGNIVSDLVIIRTKVLAKFEHIYGGAQKCHVNKLKLDDDFYKPAEWTGIHARHMTVNPTRPEHRAHFAEELHNLFRVEMYGIEHVYKPVDKKDARKRELAQEFCRGV